MAEAPKTPTFALKVHEPQFDFVTKYAEKKKITVHEATDKLLETAEGRLGALSKYGKKQAKIRKENAKPKAPKAKKEPKAKAPKKEKAAKPAKEKKPHKPKKAAAPKAQGTSPTVEPVAPAASE